MHLKESPPASEPELLQKLDHRARIVLGLFAKQETITATQVTVTLGLSERMTRNLMQAWVEQGWLLVGDDSRRKRAYKLSALYRQ